MDIQSAIAHAREVASKKYAEGMLCHANPDNRKLDECIECAKEHEQLAEWLTELQQYRQIGTLEECREAVEKRKKRKPNTRIVGSHDLQTIHYECPTCAKELAHDLRYEDIEKDEVYISGIRTQYCGECGQNILWEENDGEINMGR